MLLRDYTRSFIVNGRSVKAGDTFELPDDVAEALLRRHDTVQRITTTGVMPFGEANTTADYQPDRPVKGVAGWWEWRGRKYRKADLPDEAKALLE